MPTSIISFKAKDDVSKTMKSMADSTKSFAKETQEAKNKLNELVKQKYTLKLDADAAKKELREAEKNFAKAEDKAKALEDVVSKRAAWVAAKDNVDGVNKKIKELEKSMKDGADAAEDMGNKINAAGSGSGLAMLSSVAGGMGLGSSLKDTATEFGQFFVGSAFGSEAASVMSSAVSGAITGAMAGSVIPGIGTAVGAALGGAVGTISGLVSNLNDKDDAFKEYRDNLFDTVTADYNAVLENGMSRAQQRTKDLISLTTLTGSEDQAKMLQEAAISYGRTPPFSYDFAMSAYKNMLGLGLDVETGQTRLNGLADAAAALGWSEQQASTLYTTLENAEINNQISTRLFKQLSTLGVNANDALGFSGMTEEQADAALQAMNADEVVTKIYEYLGERFKNASSKLTDIYEGALGERDSFKEDLEAARAEGYQNARVDNLKSQSALYDQYGEQFAEQEKILGEGQAYLDNLQDTMYQQASLIVQGAMTLADSKFAGTQSASELTALQNEYKGLADQYANATNDDQKAKIAAEMASCLQQAEAIAANEFNASDIQQAFTQSTIDTARAITQDSAVNSAYWNAGYRMGQELSKGFASGVSLNIPSPSGTSVPGGTLLPNGYLDGVDAFGLYTVPYDGFTAMLHEGERVLTANQARQLDSQGGMGNVTVNISELAVREEADVDRIASELYRKIRLAQLTA